MHDIFNMYVIRNNFIVNLHQFEVHLIQNFSPQFFLSHPVTSQNGFLHPKFSHFVITPLSEMEMPAQRSLQSFFVRFIIIQHYVQQLNVIEESIIDLMDLFEDETMPHVQPLLTQMRAEVRQIRFHLDWLSSIKLLQAARLLQLHVQLYGRLATPGHVTGPTLPFLFQSL